jgi:hypothetical protein
MWICGYADSHRAASAQTYNGTTAADVYRGFTTHCAGDLFPGHMVRN